MHTRSFRVFWPTIPATLVEPLERHLSTPVSCGAGNSESQRNLDLI